MLNSECDLKMFSIKEFKFQNDAVKHFEKNVKNQSITLKFGGQLEEGVSDYKLMATVTNKEAFEDLSYVDNYDEGKVHKSLLSDAGEHEITSFSKMQSAEVENGEFNILYTTKEDFAEEPTVTVFVRKVLADGATVDLEDTKLVLPAKEESTETPTEEQTEPPVAQMAFLHSVDTFVNHTADADAQVFYKNMGTDGKKVSTKFRIKKDGVELSETQLAEMLQSLMVECAGAVELHYPEQSLANVLNPLVDAVRKDNQSDVYKILVSFKNEVQGNFEFVLTTEVEGVEPVSISRAVRIITPEQALTEYESVVKDMADSDIATIETKKAELETARIAARSAIDGLEDGDTKTTLEGRYANALNNQNEAFKLYYLYKSKNNHLSLFKVKNVGGNLPFKVMFDKEPAIGNATEAFYYAKDNNVAVPLANLVPNQNYIDMANTNGEYIYIYKIGDKFYRTAVTVAENKVSKVDDIEVDTAKIAEQGGVFIPDGKAVDTSALSNAIATANALNEAHAVGSEVGQVPQNQKEAFEQAIADAQAVLNNEDSTAEDVAKAVEDLNKAIEEFDSFIVDYTVDKTALRKAIDEYTAIANSAVVGTEIGQTTQENIDALKSAISVAQQAMDGVSDTLNYDKKEDYEADVKIIADALQALEEAKAQYDENVVSSASFAKDKVAMYETAASLFLENIRKKINI